MEQEVEAEESLAEPGPEERQAWAEVGPRVLEQPQQGPWAERLLLCRDWSHAGWHWDHRQGSNRQDKNRQVRQLWNRLVRYFS